MDLDLSVQSLWNSWCETVQMLNFSSSRKLTPLLSEHAADLLQSQTELFDWVHGFGSPLHIVMPDQAKTNLKHWQTVLQSTYENCQVHFALKACKSKSLLRTFAMAGAGADVSSVQEMTSAFSNLVRTHDMALTGPANLTMKSKWLWGTKLLFISIVLRNSSAF